jgi:GMP synthase-like glutamine amidotransferase
MENRIIKLAILDLYEGTRNLGMINIQDIVIGFSKDIDYDVFDVRGKAEVPDLSYDVYIFSGGPGDPREGEEKWMAPFHGLIDDIWNHNQFGEGSKKHCFFICHSFQMACAHFGIGKITKREMKSFGTFPVYKTEAGEKEWLFQKLNTPFWVADFRDYQVVQPDRERIAELGAEILLIEQVRKQPELERAIMGVRFSDEMIGTQFHPEADPQGMRAYFTEEERLVAILTEFGKDKLESMVKDLNHPDKIEKTHRIVLPYFLYRAIQDVRANSLELV